MKRLTAFLENPGHFQTLQVPGSDEALSALPREGEGWVRVRRLAFIRSVLATDAKTGRSKKDSPSKVASALPTQWRRNDKRGPAGHSPSPGLLERNARQRG